MFMYRKEMGSTHILLTGQPGCGKTTLVRKVVEILRAKGTSFSGFVTEEIREGAERIGFRVVTIPDGKTAPLATVHSTNATSRSLSVGRYQVCLKEFETVAIPILAGLNSEEDKFTRRLAVIDEIGKMESLSTQFCTEVIKLFDRPNLNILATIPVAKGRPLATVEKISTRPDVTVIKVDRNNRDSLVDEIVTLLSVEIQ